MEYVEKDCVFTSPNSWRKFEAGGAVVTPDLCVGYLKNPETELTDRVLERVGARGVLTDWHGKSLGTYKIVSVWRTPQSTVSSVMCQVEAEVDGVLYTGRSAGYGMVFKGKRKAQQPERAGE
jgi:hypothetical protein